MRILGYITNFNSTASKATINACELDVSIDLNETRKGVVAFGSDVNDVDAVLNITGGVDADASTIATNIAVGSSNANIRIYNGTTDVTNTLATVPAGTELTLGLAVTKTLFDQGEALANYSIKDGISNRESGKIVVLGGTFTIGKETLEISEANAATDNTTLLGLFDITVTNATFDKKEHADAVKLTLKDAANASEDGLKYELAFRNKSTNDTVPYGAGTYEVSLTSV